MNHNSVKSSWLVLSIVLTALMGAALILGNQPVVASPGTLYVSSGGSCGGMSPCYGSIQAAVNNASSNDTIKVAQGHYTSAGSEVVYVNKAIEIIGGYDVSDWQNSQADSLLTIVDAEDANRRGIYVEGSGSGTVLLDGLVVQRGAPKQGSSSADGGGVYVQNGQVTIRNSSIISSTIINAGKGAGLYVADGKVRLEDSTLQGNRAASGGGLHVQQGDVVLNSVNFLDNSAFWNGALQIGGGDVTINNSEFHHNKGGNECGALYVSGNTTVTIRDSLFQENEAENDNARGGAILVDSPGAAVTIERSVIVSNTLVSLMGSRGGGLYLNDGSVTLRDSTIQGHGATSGGGISMKQGSLVIEGSHFIDNSAFWQGALEIEGGSVEIATSTFRGNFGGNECGAVCVVGGATVTVTHSLFQNNHSANDYSRGGAILIDDAAAGLLLEHNTFMTNTVSHTGGSGGAVSAEQGVIVAKDNRFQGNSAAGGGAISVSAPDATLIGNRFDGNSAFFGGALQITGGNTTLRRNTFVGNTGGPNQGPTILIDGASVDAANDVVADSGNNPAGEGVTIWAGNLSARHWTLANNGSFALTASGGIAVLTNTVVADHSSGGFSGSGIVANRTLFHNSGTSCINSATCIDDLFGDPTFVDDNSGDFHITLGSAAMDAGIGTGLNSDLDDHHRPYGLGPDLGADEIIASPVSPSIGSQLVYTDTHGSPTGIAVPGTAVTETVTILFEPADIVEDRTGAAFANHAFSLDAYQGSSLLPDFAFISPATFTIHYSDMDMDGIDESTLLLEYWDGVAWQDAACGPYDRNPDDNWLALPVCHLSEFALFGEYRIYLPAVQSE